MLLQNYDTERGCNFIIFHSEIKFVLLSSRHNVASIENPIGLPTERKSCYCGTRFNQPDARFWHNRKQRSSRVSRAKCVSNTKVKRAMNTETSQPVEEMVLRIDESNLNHHLWNNNGTWWIHYTTYPTSVTAERIRRSLKTKIVEEARGRRDQFFQKKSKSKTAIAA